MRNGEQLHSSRLPKKTHWGENQGRRKEKRFHEPRVGLQSGFLISSDKKLSAAEGSAAV